MGNIIDGKKIASNVKQQVKDQVADLKQKGISVCLAVVIVGDDPASKIYVGSKKRACEMLGIQSREFALPQQTSEEELLQLVNQLNQDPQVNGILVQLPLPKQMDTNQVIAMIAPEKDVDAFHAVNVGNIMIGTYDFLPCTPAGCLELIASTGTVVAGKHAVVIGRSNIVGKPMSMLLLHQSATVTICHSKTTNLDEICRTADIIVAAVGIPKLVTGDMIQPGAVVIDVGMNRLEDGTLCGDVDFETAREVCSHITPVPGGVGPMTIAMLMKNTVTAAKLQHQQSMKA